MCITVTLEKRLIFATAIYLHLPREESWWRSG